MIWGAVHLVWPSWIAQDIKDRFVGRVLKEETAVRRIMIDFIYELPSLPSNNMRLERPCNVKYVRPSMERCSNSRDVDLAEEDHTAIANHFRVHLIYCRIPCEMVISGPANLLLMHLQGVAVGHFKLL